ncbi:splicing factor, arginine/serine-rich 2,rnap C-term interacting protein, putative [Schistosoma mansoni]|uniref:Splicing factor, arginine/serine-rich 2,rnap C-term interacting protein, putative n=1 Tax=Schistosoma mansoni TaxID=6183 RepID=G4LYY5_SCHMA|nr:splicing factor, arginine/serine-rich 2,rnap C-term interacting protein, putative [Schistosoma mansoni]|eukprot:XP_018646462.1 splicing factor, arginine/serine-rich 2,rnap C-term interacting protein, putative [Schistosoma mansoni]
MHVTAVIGGPVTRNTEIYPNSSHGEMWSQSGTPPRHPRVADHLPSPSSRSRSPAKSRSSVNEKRVTRFSMNQTFHVKQRKQHNELSSTTSTLLHSLVLPPLREVINPFSSNGICDKIKPNGACGENKNESRKHFGEKRILEVLAERKRYDFFSRSEWQERIGLEIKLVLKPARSPRRINEEDYKDIMKKAVSKISRSGTSLSNTEKTSTYVRLYIEKYRRMHKMKAQETTKTTGVYHGIDNFLNNSKYADAIGLSPGLNDKTFIVR